MLPHFQDYCNDSIERLNATYGKYATTTTRRTTLPTHRTTRRTTPAPTTTPDPMNSEG